MKGTQDMKMIKIAAYINILYMLTSLPPFIGTNILRASFLINYTIFLSSCGGPIIYLKADKSFREEFVKLLKRR